jgi:hypothetical protein
MLSVEKYIVISFEDKGGKRVFSAHVDHWDCAFSGSPPSNNKKGQVFGLAFQLLMNHPAAS